MKKEHEKCHKKRLKKSDLFNGPCNTFLVKRKNNENWLKTIIINF